MRNTKEIKAILTALYCLNQTGHDDQDLTKILKYAFNRILKSSANILTLCCVGKNQKDIMPEIEQLLKEDTDYIKYKEQKKAYDR